MAEHKNIWAALLAVQAEIEDPGKPNKVDAGKRSYAYSGLQDCVPYLRKLLASHDVVLCQWVDIGHTDKGAVRICTDLRHVPSDSVCASMVTVYPQQRARAVDQNGMPIGEVDWVDPQATGGAITYARKYGLWTALNLAPDEADDDGSHASGKDVKITRQSSPGPSTTAPPKSRQAKPQPSAENPQQDLSAALAGQDPGLVSQLGMTKAAWTAMSEQDRMKSGAVTEKALAVLFQGLTKKGLTTKDACIDWVNEALKLDDELVVESWQMTLAQANYLIDAC